MNQALKRLDGEYTMLHYPYYLNENDSFYDAQKNLTDYCLSQLPGLKGKNVLEIGCGNGTQAMYISDKCSPSKMTGIDLNPMNIEIAKNELKKKETKNILFQTDDAQKLSTIKSKSMDYVINIESAFHYPDKASFLNEIFRVLKSGGTFLIADIMSVPRKTSSFKKYWKTKMHLHHWPRHMYENEMLKSKLNVLQVTDITGNVIRGFEHYKNWLRNMKKKNFIEGILLKIFYTINVRLNIYLLKSRRQYCVIVGEKTD